MKDCIFCKIVNGEIPFVKIWEDKDYIAILDVKPNTKGMSLVISKKHFDSDIFDLSDDELKKIIISSKKVSQLLKKGLNVKRVSIVCEGMGINHLHVKLYPLHGLKNKFEEIYGGEIKYFKEYQGYITTEVGPKKSFEELNKIAEEIKINLKNSR